MRKRLILAVLGMMAVLVGVATFAANTAQWVNVEARVEKEIEVACVREVDEGVWEVHPNGCDFGVVFPQNRHERFVEVTTSNSFQNNQTYKSSILYRVYWECKQFSDGRDLDGNGVPDCRVDVEQPHKLCYDEVEAKWVHCDPEVLDGMIRDHLTVRTDPGCLDTYTGPTPPDVKHIEAIGQGSVTKKSPKCFYDLIFEPPACEGHFNPYTDPNSAPTTVACHEKIDDADPQKWDRWADLGDDFKIQVYDFGIEIP